MKSHFQKLFIFPLWESLSTVSEKPKFDSQEFSKVTEEEFVSSLFTEFKFTEYWIGLSKLVTSVGLGDLYIQCMLMLRQHVLLPPHHK